MSKPFVLGFIVGVALLIVAGVGASRLQRRDVARINADAEEREYQAKIVDATPVQFGALSEKQRVHSKLYTDYRERRGGRTISGLVAEAKGKGRIARTIAEGGRRAMLTEPETPENYFGKLAHASDAVIRGKVTKKASQISENDGFVFTDYDVIVTEVLKNNATARLDIGATIIVTNPGGTVLLDGVIVEAIDMCFEPLQINHDVILFLRYIPETEAYKATRDTGSFELDGSILHPLTKSGFPPGVLQSKDSFLHTVRDISNR